MCKKFIFSICFILAMFVISVPASADQGMTYYDNIILKVDIDAFEKPNPQTGWDSWQMPSYWGSFGPINKTFNTAYYGPVTVQMNGYLDGVGGNFAGSRERYATAPNGDNDFGCMYKDLVYVPKGAGGVGLDYVKIDFFFDNLVNQEIEITTWSWDPAFGFNPDTYGGAGEPADSKIATWSTTDPRQWLIDNGEPNGYQPGSMPAGLQALVLNSNVEIGLRTWATPYDNRYGMGYASSYTVMVDDMGIATVYGWADMTTWAGSQHMSLNGFAISIPEPATVALLGLGGLSLLRRKRR